MKSNAEYNTYLRAKGRCTNPRQPDYSRYGGRGIEFRFTSFEQFFTELGRRPPGLSLDRINNDGHYEPGNVRWATRSQQVRNQRPRTRRETSTSSSGYKGVYWDGRPGRRRRWRAEIFINGKTKYLGYFETKEEARDAYNQVSL